MEFLFRDRGSGKRQVKPSQEIALLEDQLAGGESSDDEDFTLPEKGKNSVENSDNASSDSGDSDDEGDSDSSGGDSSDGDDNDSLEGEAATLEKGGSGLPTSDLLALSKGQLSSISDSLTKDVKVCGCCLGSSSSDANEIVDCDGCGISVHEGCYGVSESGSVASTVSSASTEPWFCEVCRAGLLSPPPCELCPLVGGIYKQTEVGRWVHLVCALYVPGVAFGDTDKMSHVTIFEMNYSMWGRKACSLCASQDQQIEGLTGGVRMARTGVVIQCDAGLCRAFFHASCAQAAGLLSEPTYASSNIAGHVDDTYLAHCKLHSDRQVVRKRRKAFLIHHVSHLKKRENIRKGWALTKPLPPSQRLSSRALPDEQPEERILRKLYRKQAGFTRDNAARHEPWLPTQKLPRLLTTSASAIRKIQRLQHLAHDTSIEDQQKHEVEVMTLAEAKKKWHVPPGFSVEFTAYYQDREKRLVDLKGQVENDLEQNRQLVTQDAEVRRKYDESSKTNDESLQKNNKLRSTIATYRSVLEKLSGGKLPSESSIPALKPLVKSYDIVTPNIMARATVYSQFKNTSTIRPPFSKTTVESARGTNDLNSPAKINQVCAICKRSHDQHLLAHCDTCKLYYHLSCLTPPLTRMPKKSKLYGWSCSECYPVSSSDDETHPDGVNEEDDAKKRNRSRRLAASKALVANSDFDWDVKATGSGSAANRHSLDSSVGSHTTTPGAAVSGSTDPRRNTPAAAASSQSKKRGRPPGSKNSTPKAKKPKISRPSQSAEDDDDVEMLTPMPDTSSLHGGLYPTNGSTGSDHQSSAQKAKQQKLIDKAAEKARKKEAKRAEKQKKKLERKLQKQRMKEQQKAASTEEEEEEEEDEVEIVEDESGQCIVQIKPKPIKLEINLSKDIPALRDLPTITDSDRAEGTGPSSDETGGGSNRPAPVAASESSRRSSSASKASGGGGKGDKRTECAKCPEPGTNANLVRCDECKKCYHFDCLVPPVKKSPKVAGWSWHCIDCDPSDAEDSDWHLD